MNILIKICTCTITYVKDTKNIKEIASVGSRNQKWRLQWESAGINFTKIEQGRLHTKCKSNQSSSSLSC